MLWDRNFPLNNGRNYCPLGPPWARYKAPSLLLHLFDQEPLAAKNEFGESGSIKMVHPGRLTWNLQITPLERKMTLQTSMIMEPMFSSSGV